MNNNFFKKHLVAITVFSLIGIIIVIWLYQGTNDIKKEGELGKYPLRGQKIDKTPSLKHEFDQSTPSRTKRETEPLKSKFKTTQSRFDKIKAYILSETDDKSLLPNNLSQEEKSEINKKRNELINDFEKTKQKWNPRIEQEQQKCDNYNHEIKEIQDKFPSLKSKQTNLQKKHDDKVQEINQVKSQLQNKKSQLQTQGISIYNNHEIDELKTEISKLQKERGEIMEQIAQVSTQIGKLESTQKSLTAQLGHAEKFKNELIQSRDELLNDCKDLIISILQSYYEITSAEG